MPISYKNIAIQACSVTENFADLTSDDVISQEAEEEGERRPFRVNHFWKLTYTANNYINSGALQKPSRDIRLPDRLT